MRPKLVPNYKFDPHQEASRLRDNEGGNSSEFNMWMRDLLQLVSVNIQENI